MKETLKDYMMDADSAREVSGYTFRHKISPEEFYDYKIKSYGKEGGKMMLEIDFVDMHANAPESFHQPLSKHLNDSEVPSQS